MAQTENGLSHSLLEETMARHKKHTKIVGGHKGKGKRKGRKGGRKHKGTKR